MLNMSRRWFALVGYDFYPSCIEIHIQAITRGECNFPEDLTRLYYF
jgi:hypothetical protein